MRITNLGYSTLIVGNLAMLGAEAELRVMRDKISDLPWLRILLIGLQMEKRICYEAIL